MPSTHVHPAIGQSVGQFSVLPQPSPTLPQYRPPPAVSQVAVGVQYGGAPTHMEFWQVHPDGQVCPQFNVPPQPLPMVPQY
jgi:hypothetical protein